MQTDNGKVLLRVRPRGFCAGVVRAVDIVELALEAYGAPVLCTMNRPRREIHKNPLVDPSGAHGMLEVLQFRAGLLKLELTPQKVSLAISSSRPPDYPAFFTANGHYASAIGLSRNQVGHSSWLPTLGKFGMSRRPPWVFTSRACAFSMTIRPPASCHLACTGTITGNRLPRRWSVFGLGGAETSSSTKGVPGEV